MILNCSEEKIMAENKCGCPHKRCHATTWPALYSGTRLILPLNLSSVPLIVISRAIKGAREHIAPGAVGPRDLITPICLGSVGPLKINQQ